MLCRKIDFIVSMKMLWLYFHKPNRCFLNTTDQTLMDTVLSYSLQTIIDWLCVFNCCLFKVHGSWCQRVTLRPSPKSSLRQDADETSTIWPGLLHPCLCIITRPILYAGQRFNGKKKKQRTYKDILYVLYCFKGLGFLLSLHNLN